MFEQKDLIQADNLMRALKKGEWKLTGEEILAFNQMFSWTASLVLKMRQEVALSKQKFEMASAVIDSKSNPNTSKPKVKKGSE